MTRDEHDGSHYFNKDRTSTSAYINRHQTYLVKCLARRFAQFQGGIDVQRMEPFQVVKYIDNQEVKYLFNCLSTTLSKNFFFSLVTIV